MTWHRWCTLVALALIGGFTSRLGAQDASSLTPGARVRLWKPSSIEGTLTALDATTLRIRDDQGRSVEVVRLHDMRLLVYGGPGPCSGSRRGWCVLGGGVAGSAIGALTMLIVSTNEFSDSLDPSVVLVGAPLGALLGAALGGIVGGDRWQRVTLPAASVAPTARRVELQVRLTF